MGERREPIRERKRDTARDRESMRERERDNEKEKYRDCRIHSQGFVRKMAMNASQTSESQRG